VHLNYLKTPWRVRQGVFLPIGPEDNSIIGVDAKKWLDECKFKKMCYICHRKLSIALFKTY
jgi:hypothetical protein